MRDVYSISAYLHNTQKENIQYNFITNKWILKINESSPNIDRRILYVSILFGILFSLLIFAFVFEHHIFYIKNNVVIKDPIKSRTITILDNQPNIQIIPTKVPTKRTRAKNCEPCSEDEICLQRSGSIATCTKIIDSRDPTGCGGNCKLRIETCREIKKGSQVFQCLEVQPQTCEKGQYICGDLCLNSTQICDGVINCIDFSDELNCACNVSTHFKCSNKTSCLPNSYKCNGTVDCWDASDETNCNYDCQEGVEFLCLDNSRCLALSKFCDGVQDCKDNSDEPLGCIGLKFRL